MGTSPANIPLRDIQTLFNVGAVGGMSDGQLLGQFAACREAAAFEALIHRHGPMVWCVCRRVLRDHHDAEEAFQATFLVLARRADSLARTDLVAGWLYAVAYRSARKARAMKAKRRARERPISDVPEPEASPRAVAGDMAELLDREVGRLQEKYRIPVVLCELEGKSHREAAELLGWPIGTVSGRLSKARALLARRLSRPGTMLSAGSLATWLSSDVASAGVPEEWVASTARAAIGITTGRAAGAGLVSAGVAALTRGVMISMLTAKAKVFLALLMLGILGAGVARWSYTTSMAAVADDPAPRDQVEADLARMQGEWSRISSEAGGNKRMLDEPRPQLIVTGNEFNFGGAPERVTIDPRPSPRSIDLTPTGDSAGPLKGKTYPGIYKIEGDTLTLCLSVAPGSPRPTKFETKGTTWVVDVYERRMPEDRADRQPSPVQDPHDASETALLGSPKSEFGGGPDEPLYIRHGHIFCVISPNGDRFSIYDAVTKKASVLRLPGTKESPIKVRPNFNFNADASGPIFIPFSKKSLLSLSLGGKITRLYVFSFADWRWFPLDLKAPIDATKIAVFPDMGQSVVAYAYGAYVYAFGAEARRWDVFKSTTRAPNDPRVTGDSVVVEADGHLHEFTSKTGQWKHTDLRAAIDAAIKAAEEAEAK